MTAPVTLADMTGTVRTPEKREALLQSLGAGASRLRACEAAAIGRRTFYTWLNDDDDFRTDVEAAEAGCTMSVEDALYRKALDGNTTAMIFWLQNRAPDRWQDRRNLRVSGDPDGVPVQVQVEQDYLDRRIAELLESMERAEDA